MINSTLDNRRSLSQLIIGVSFFLAFQDIRKSLKYLKFRLTTNQDLFQALSSVKFGESWILDLLGGGGLRKNVS